MVWKEVIEALDSIIDDYERVNHLISFFQDDKARLKGLEKASPIHGVSLELGSGPGNYSAMIQEHIESELVCLDFSGKMHAAAKERNAELNHHYIRGVFEVLPFRTEAMGFVAAAYALRDSLDKEASFKEAHRVLGEGGKFLLVDIGKPDNFILRSGMSTYMHLMVPFIGAIASRGRPNNPWRILFDTFKLLPLNGSLQRMITSVFGYAEMTELSLGGLVILTSEKN
ncbi:class I SAM-dependent methyltransferase [Candidatus Bathyarchaeota archaeon]|nr:class I SAM-dependent methyltransferase [Candidatus Bathyarchaeota archaeon]MBT4319363.1 class I SAM-dependent methyltransferase [Candidatus Bathyarchaeota archaeon]MBT4424158.1 class I SAM-dependent methyltransferase [Candidatus Bathyarchaeota archaeon]MBT5643437.1 class I SAM-dependent methyltransferase [Candidatus Bathyarchaeota archaeon]MBT6605100.1 class I SAM-dependent methyltransferase [Candidatus Bathyarchaeota archaeon]